MMRFSPSNDPRIVGLTLNEICALALRQLASDKRKADGGARIAEIKKRLEAATEGPWYAGKPIKNEDYGYENVTVGPFEAEEHSEDTICDVWGSEHDARANADFIANAPADIAYLLGEPL